MSELLPGLWRAEALVALAWLALAGSVLSLILVAGRSIGRRLNLRLWGVPEALVAGILGLLVAPSGPLPLLPQHLMELWGELPLVLLTLVFGSLMLGKPLPKPRDVQVHRKTPGISLRHGLGGRVVCVRLIGG